MQNFFLFSLVMMTCTLANAKPALAFREYSLAVASRTGVTVPVVVTEREGASVSQVAVWLNGGGGHIAPVSSQPEPQNNVRARLAQEIGVVAAVGVPSDRSEIDIPFRETPEHLQDLAAVAEMMKQRYPGASISIIGLSNGARSAAFAASVQNGLWQRVALMSASVVALRDDWVQSIKVPILVVHHRRDSCLRFTDIADKASRHDFIRVDDSRQPRVRNATTERDCSRTSAHQFAGREDAVYQAVGEWILTGKVSADIN